MASEFYRQKADLDYYTASSNESASLKDVFTASFLYRRTDDVDPSALGAVALPRKAGKSS